VPVEPRSVHRPSEESGWSRGVVQLYFRDKDDLLLCALERAAARAKVLNRATVGERTGLAAARALLPSHARPTDEQLMINAVLVALQTQAVTRVRLREAYDTLMNEWRERTVNSFFEMAQRGELRGGRDPRAAALAYFALALGLRLQTGVRRDVFCDDAELVVDQFLAALVPA
jgi:TetR/AcrR family transcriptional repressor of bet genes